MQRMIKYILYLSLKLYYKAHFKFVNVNIIFEVMNLIKTWSSGIKLESVFNSE